MNFRSTGSFSISTLFVHAQGDVFFSFHIISNILLHFCRSLDCNLPHLPVVQKSVIRWPSKCLQHAAKDSDSSFIRIECHFQHPGIPFLFSFLQSSHLQKRAYSPLDIIKLFFSQARYRGLSFLSKLPLIHNHPSVGLLILLGVLLQARQKCPQYHPGKIPSEYPQA